MKRKKMLSIILGGMFLLTSCGQQEVTEKNQETNVEQTTEQSIEQTTEGEVESQQTTEPENVTEEIKETDITQQPVSEVNEEPSTTEYYQDNFSVEKEVVVEYGTKIKEAVAEKNLEKLAELTGFPVYVGFVEEGIVVNAPEEFIALGEEKIFTENLVNAMVNANLDDLSPSMAGFVLSDENGKPNIIYGVQEGSLKITGINY